MGLEKPLFFLRRINDIFPVNQPVIIQRTINTNINPGSAWSHLLAYNTKKARYCFLVIWQMKTVYMVSIYAKIVPGENQ